MGWFGALGRLMFGSPVSSRYVVDQLVISSALGDDPPTTKQLAYAKKLGIVVTTAMTKFDVSKAIAVAEKANPAVSRRREQITRKLEEGARAERLAEFGPELLESEKQWQDFCDSDCYLLAIYRKGKGIVVDVLQVSDASIEGVRKKKLVLSVVAPKLVKDRHIGSYLDWDRSFELPLECLLQSETLPSTFHELGLEAYQKAVERGLKLASRLK